MLTAIKFQTKDHISMDLANSYTVIMIPLPGIIVASLIVRPVYNPLTPLVRRISIRPALTPLPPPPFCLSSEPLDIVLDDVVEVVSVAKLPSATRGLPVQGQQHSAIAQHTFNALVEPVVERVVVETVWALIGVGIVVV